MTQYQVTIGTETYNLRRVLASCYVGILPQQMQLEFWGSFTGGQTIESVQWQIAELKREGTVFARFRIKRARIVREGTVRTAMLGHDARYKFTKSHQIEDTDIKYYIDTNLTAVAADVALSSGLTFGTVDSVVGLFLECTFLNTGEVLTQAALASQKEIGFNLDETIDVKATVGSDKSATVSFSNDTCRAVDVGRDSMDLMNEMWSLQDLGFAPLGGYSKDLTSQGVYEKMRMVKILRAIMNSSGHVNLVDKLVTDLANPMSVIFARTYDKMDCNVNDKVNVNLDDASGTFRVVGITYSWSEEDDEVIIYELRSLSYILSMLFMTPFSTMLSAQVDKASSMPFGNIQSGMMGGM